MIVIPIISGMTAAAFARGNALVAGLLLLAVLLMAKFREEA